MIRLGDIKRIALNLLYPDEAICVACSKPIADAPGGLCAECAAKLIPIEGERCVICGRPIGTDISSQNESLCRDCRHRPLEQRAIGLAPYEHKGTAAELVYALKFSTIRSAAAILAQGMAACIPDSIETLTPVPLYRTRQRERGYNQARVLCEEISERTGLPILDALARHTATHRQMKLDGAKRELNVRGAFRVIEPVAGLHIAVVDDVRTTGATARECAKALYESGAFDVFILTATVSVLK